MKSLVYNVLWVCTWGYLGVLARVGLAEAAARNSVLAQLGTGYFLPNVLGSFVMGVVGGLQSHTNPFYHLFIGITTGFCGCCTTFATWQFKTAMEMLELAGVASLMHLFITYSTSFIALRLGKHVAALLKPHYFPQANNDLADSLNSCSPTMQSCRVVPKQQLLPLFVAFMVSTVGIWILIFLGPDLRKPWFVAMAFAPLGAGLRYLLSQKNSHFPNFPFFTFFPNVVATGINMVLAILQSSPIVTNYDAASQQLIGLWLGKGVSTGFMGSLSTVSTWVNEIDKLMENKALFWAYVYGMMSVLAAQMLALILGGVWLAAGNSFQ